MADLEGAGVLEELLLQQRVLVDSGVYPLVENARLGDLLAVFQSTILALQHREPSFWQLQVVQFIRNVLKTRVGRCIDDAVGSTELQDPMDVVARVKEQIQTSEALETSLQQVQSDVEKEVARLTEILHTDKENLTVQDGDEHFLAKFWETLHSVVESREKQPKSDEEREAEGLETEFESCSFENLTFEDDFNDMSRSAMSFPCVEDFPNTIRRIQSTDGLERVAGLDELMQMPMLEIIHSGPIFPTVCSAIVGLFLDTEVSGERRDTAERAKRVVFNVMNQVEDAAQFSELYWAVVDFMGSHLETGELFLGRQEVCENDNARCVAVVDCFRVLCTLLYKVIRHWVYFSTEQFAQLIHSTFRLLTIYAKAETEVEAKWISPFMMLSLVDDDPLRWFKLWLLNAPSLQQLFVAIDESGFVADVLQHLSRLRPLSPIKSSNPSVDAIEKRITQCALGTVSFICEYQQGRELVSRWQRMPAHTYIKQRRTIWERPALETVAMDNDSLYRIVQYSLSGEEFHEELETRYEHLGITAIDALVLSIAALIVTDSHEDAIVPYNARWVEVISNSVTTYLHTTHIDDLLVALGKLVEACWEDNMSKVAATTKPKERDPWFPFRHPKSAADVCLLVISSISRTIWSSTTSKTDTQISGVNILQMMLSSEAVTNAGNDAVKLIFGLCKRFLESWDGAPSEKMTQQPNKSKVFALIAGIARSAHAFKLANQTGAVGKLWEISCSRSSPDECLRYSDSIASLCRSVAGICYAYESRASNDWMHGMSDLDFKTDNFLQILACLSLPTISEAVFSRDIVHTSIYQVVDQLKATVDFTMALNSPDDECPPQLTRLMRRLQLLRCCLSTQFASSSLFLLKENPLVQFIKETLTIHTQGCCMDSCNAEDTCCVVFQLVLSLVSSVPAMLQCSDMLSKLRLLKLDDESLFVRDLLCSDKEVLGSCSFLEKQLCYNFEFIGGSCEKLHQYELCDFDGHFRQNNTINKKSSGVEKSVEKAISDFAFTLQNKILQVIKDGVESGSATPMNFVLISQASWELIIDLEAGTIAPPSFVTCRSAAGFTEIFATVIYNLVMSKRSRLELPVNSNTDGLDMSTVTSSLHNDKVFFPTDSARKLMNRWYKNYTHWLSLPSSPTLLHCIVKNFGKAAMDCFPVTILMILYPTYEEADILCFLSQCIHTPSAPFLWPTTDVDGDIPTRSAISIGEGVEIIMEREFPEVLQVIDQCHCSLLALVQRWHGQSFWNYFDWENVVLYTYLSILYGAEFQVYCIVAILKHLEPSMRALTTSPNSQSLMSFLRLIREPIQNFRFSSWRTLLLRLRSEYHEEIVDILFQSA